MAISHANDLPALLETARRKLELKGLHTELRVLEASSPDLEETEYDNWQGRQTCFTLYLDIPVGLFVEFEDRLGELQTCLLTEIGSLWRDDEGDHLAAVVLRSSLDPSGDTPLITPKSTPPFWQEGMFKLFVSHVARIKEKAHEVKDSCSSIR